jgi:hypothetical protein
VVREPQVVLVEEGDERRGGKVDADVVRAGLLPDVPGEAYHPDPRVADPLDDRHGVVGGRVVDDDRLPVLEPLRAERRQGVREDVAATVRGDDDGDVGRAHPQGQSAPAATMS